MKQIQRKSISLEGAFPAVGAIALVGIMIVVMIFMFTSLQIGVGNSISEVTINESGTIIGTGHLLANSTNCNFASPSIDHILNASDSVLITPGNYTIGSDNYLINSTARNWVSVLITYNYLDGGSACVATKNSSTAFIGIIPMVGLILIIVLIGIVVGVLIKSFTGGRRKA